MFNVVQINTILGELIAGKYVAELITMIAVRLGHEGICQLCTKLSYAVDKGLRGQNVLQSLLLILLRICSRSVCLISTKVAMSLYDIIDTIRCRSTCFIVVEQIF